MYVQGMVRGTRRALGLVWKSKYGTDGIRVEELEVPRSADAVPASVFFPAGTTARLPGWVVLHGVTRPGRNHPTLLGFVRALAGSGAVVLVPEIPEWRELHLCPEGAAETVSASVPVLARHPRVQPHRIGVLGNSFGVPMALRAATAPELREHIRVVAGFGGYCSLHRTLHFLFRGEHEWEGRTYRANPDPYGRWVVTGNYLTQVPGFEQAGDVAEALLRLARYAGDTQVGAWHERFDAKKRELEASVHPSRRDLLRAIAPPAGTHPPTDLATELAAGLAKAGEAGTNLFQPSTLLEGVRVPVRLIHGRGDRLIPFTETLRLREAFPRGADVRADLTSLLAHSRNDGDEQGQGELLERLHLFRVMANLLGLL